MHPLATPRPKAPHRTKTNTGNRKLKEPFKSPYKPISKDPYVGATHGLPDEGFDAMIVLGEGGKDRGDIPSLDILTPIKDISSKPKPQMEEDTEEWSDILSAPSSPPGQLFSPNMKESHHLVSNSSFPSKLFPHSHPNPNNNDNNDNNNNDNNASYRIHTPSPSSLPRSSTFSANPFMSIKNNPGESFHPHHHHHRQRIVSNKSSPYSSPYKTGTFSKPPKKSSPRPHHPPFSEREFQLLKEETHLYLEEIQRLESELNHFQQHSSIESRRKEREVKEMRNLIQGLEVERDTMKGEMDDLRRENGWLREMGVGRGKMKMRENITVRETENETMNTWKTLFDERQDQYLHLHAEPENNRDESLHWNHSSRLPSRTSTVKGSTRLAPPSVMVSHAETESMQTVDMGQESRLTVPSHVLGNGDSKLSEANVAQVSGEPNCSPSISTLNSTLIIDPPSIALNIPEPLQIIPSPPSWPLDISYLHLPTPNHHPHTYQTTLTSYLSSSKTMLSRWWSGAYQEAEFLVVLSVFVYNAIKEGRESTLLRVKEGNGQQRVNDLMTWLYRD